jgi:hypothetical protein
MPARSLLLRKLVQFERLLRPADEQQSMEPLSSKQQVRQPTIVCCDAVIVWPGHQEQLCNHAHTVGLCTVHLRHTLFVTDCSCDMAISISVAPYPLLDCLLRRHVWSAKQPQVHTYQP